MLNKIRKGNLCKILAVSLILCMMSTIVFADDITDNKKVIKTQFEDVNSDTQDWYKQDLVEAVEKGLINGKSDTKYYPDDKVTVAEWVQVLFNIGKPVYYSVAEKGTGKWYDSNFCTLTECSKDPIRINNKALYVAMGADNNEGLENWDIVANKPITRADAITLAVATLTNYRKDKKNKDLCEFIRQANIYEFEEHFKGNIKFDMYDGYAVPVSYGVLEGLMDGVGEKDGMIVFKPFFSMDRRQLAVLANRISKYVKENNIDMNDYLYFDGKVHDKPLEQHEPWERDMDYRREGWKSLKYTEKWRKYKWDFEYSDRPRFN